MGDLPSMLGVGVAVEKPYLQGLVCVGCKKIPRDCGCPRPTEVKIPFRDSFKEMLMVGRKIKTTRTQRLGLPWDYFMCAGVRFRITGVERLTLREVADKHFIGEGCGTPEEFKEIWRQIHPWKGFHPDQQVFLHTFQRIPES